MDFSVGDIITVGTSEDEWPARVVGFYGDGQLIVQSVTGIPEQEIEPGQAWVMDSLYVFESGYTGDKPL